MSGDRYKIFDQNACYFLTLTVVDWVDLFTRREYKIVLTDSLNYCVKNKGLEVFAWVIMSNHVHLMVRAKQEFRLSDIMRDFKKHTSKTFISIMEEIGESRKDWLLHKFSFEAGRSGRANNYKVWRDDNHAICMDDTQWIIQRLHYIHQNPVRQMIVRNAQEYLFSSAIDYAEGKGLVEITLA